MHCAEDKTAAHLRRECVWLDLLLQRQVLRMRRVREQIDDKFRGLYIADAEADELLRSAVGHSSPALDRLQLQIDVAEAEIESCLATATDLPLAQLRLRCGLSPLELRVLIVALAPELDLRYQTLFAYVQNDV